MSKAQATQIVETVETVEVVEVAAPQTFDLEALMTEYKTKSTVIRFLTTQGQTRSQIAKFMGIRYQHVRNVLTQPLKAPAPTVETKVEEPEEVA
jgi:2-C-methyl-D-erythritol 4-phosphate cytidylyltransferase